MRRHLTLARHLVPDSPHHDSAFETADLRIGSLLLRVRSIQPRFIEMLNELIRTRPIGSVASPAPHTLFLTILDDHQPSPELSERKPEALAFQPDGGPQGQPLFEIRGDLDGSFRSLVCETGPERTDAVMAVDGQSADERILSSLMIAIYRTLYHLGRVLLHAAAIGSVGGTNLLVGDKGSGKTTCSLYLGKRGLTVLAEDHVLLHRHSGSAESDLPHYTVSGCDDRMRLTRKTELRFFEEGLELPVTDVAGIPKKELDPTTLSGIHWRPFEDLPVRRLFLPSVGDEFKVVPMPALPAVLNLVGTLKERFRFADHADRQRFLDYFIDFVEPLEVYRLTLSPDLDQLDRLHQWFEERGEVG